MKSPATALRARAAALAPLVAGAALFSSSCATYTMRTREAWNDFQRGQLDQAREAYANTDVTGSVFLSGAEAGTVALTGGDWAGALEQLSRAANEAREFEDRTLLSPDKAAEDLASWILNDTKKKYLGEGFERVYLHGGMALAYLALGKLDDVWVENRLANELLEHEEKLYEKKYAAGGLGHFLSALAYELLGQLDHAYIDYRRMEEKGVGLELAGRALVRIARALDYSADLEQLVERHGPVEQLPEDWATIVVVAGVGTAPFKVEGSLTLPTEDGLFRMAVPSYQRRPQPVSALRLSVPSARVSVRTAVIENVSSIAVENLEDRLLWTTTKSIGRGILKRQLTKKLEDDHGLGGRLIGDLFALATERADLRSWQTLPDTWQAARVFVPAGRHELEVHALGGEANRLGTFELDPGETMIVFARSVGRKLYVHPMGGKRVAAGTSDPSAPVGEAVRATPDL